MDSARNGIADEGNAGGADGCPSETFVQIVWTAYLFASYETHIVGVYVSLIVAVEKHHIGCSM